MRLFLIALVACGGSGATSKAKPVEQPRLHRIGRCPLERDDGAYHIEMAEKSLRRGANDKKFSDSHSTDAEPIQVCGLRSELEWLVRVTCDDGSRPWGRNLDNAHKARQGSHMPEVKESVCTKPTDIYVASCPEHEYWIYLDQYHCAPDEELYRPVLLQP